MKTIAIILAGGTGSRFGGDTPKQYTRINGKMIIEHTIEVFQYNAMIDEIMVVCHADYISFIQENICVRYSKVKQVIAGGSERWQSSVNAINACSGDEKKLLIHDAARPFVSSQIINNCISKLDNYNAVGVGISSTDTIWEVTDGILKHIPKRSTMYRAQTPQGFKLSTISKAYKIAAEQSSNIIATDDCGIVMKYIPDTKIALIQGDEKNIKITTQNDLENHNTKLPY